MKRKTGYEYGRRVFIFEHDRRQLSYGPVVLLHAARDGSPVLRGQSSWRTVCGVLVSGKTWHCQLQFRRFSR